MFYQSSSFNITKLKFEKFIVRLQFVDMARSAGLHIIYPGQKQQDMFELFGVSIIFS